MDAWNFVASLKSEWGLAMMDSFSLLAYFDPGSGSLVLQAIVGGSAGMFVFCRYLLSSLGSRLRSSRVVERVE